MPDYSLGKIYRIYSESTGLQYIGSTCEPTIAKRIAKHRNSYNFYKAMGKKYMSSYEVLECDDYQYELIELYPCACRDELRAREGYWIRKGKNDNNCVNIKVAGQTKKEYYDTNKDKTDEYQKEYRKANKNKIKDYIKEYHDANKDKIKTRKSEKITCDCGSVVIKNNFSRHNNSIKHQKYLATL